MELYERIYQIRKARNMTQQDLADKLKVSRQAVSRWEMGTAVPELEHLKNMAGIFGITMDELVTGQTPAPAVPGKRRGRRWIIAWAAVSAAAILASLVWLLWEWKTAGAMMALSPMTLTAQLVNIPLTLGLVFGFVYLIWRVSRK